MKSVFEASSGLDAHMILNLLEQHGISGRIEGEYLQGGIGELSAMGFVRVLVADEDYGEARKIIGEWDALQPPDAALEPEAGSSVIARAFVAGIFVGALLMYGLSKILSG